MSRHCTGPFLAVAVSLVIASQLGGSAYGLDLFETPRNSHTVRFYPVDDSDAGIYVVSYWYEMFGTTVSPLDKEGYYTTHDYHDQNVSDNNWSGCAYTDMANVLSKGYSFWITTHGTENGNIGLEWYTSEGNATTRLLNLITSGTILPGWAWIMSRGSGGDMRWAVAMTPEGIKHYSHNPAFWCLGGTPPPYTSQQQICFFDTCFTGSSFPLVYGAGMELGYDFDCSDESEDDARTLFRDMAGWDDGTLLRNAKASLAVSSYHTGFCREVIAADLVLCPAKLLDIVRTGYNTCIGTETWWLPFDCKMLSTKYPKISVSPSPAYPVSMEWSSPVAFSLVIVIGGLTSGNSYQVTLSRDAPTYLCMGQYGVFDVDFDRYAPNCDAYQFQHVPY